MPDRRFRGRARGVARIPCRVCFRAVDLHPDFMEWADAGWVLRCPECRHTFPVRAEDSAAALALRADARVAVAVGDRGGARHVTSAPSPVIAGQASIAGAPVRVVVVDDEPDVRLLLNAVLASPGVEIVGEADDGFDALELVKSTKPDVVVLDLMLPTLSGLDVLRALRHEDSGVRVIAVSAMAEDTAEREALDAGADLFVSKLDLNRRLLGAVTGH
ncbi:MAG TPA: response regulator [Acidimicrobiales bacterium]|nr:response regulator [Acidimicrobiales bacterium]